MVYYKFIVGSVTFVFFIAILVIHLFLRFNKNISKYVGKINLMLVFAYINMTLTVYQLFDNIRTYSFLALQLFVQMLLFIYQMYVWVTFDKKPEKAQKNTFYVLVMPFKKIIEVYRTSENDKMSFVKRLLLALVPCVSLCYMVTLFGVFELFFANVSEWRFIFDDIFVPSIIIFILSSLFLMLTIALLFRGRLYYNAVSLISLISLIAYIQNAFLNGNGRIGIETPDWTQMLPSSVISLSVVFLLFVILYYFTMRFGKKSLYVALPISGLLLVMQLVPLPVLLINAPENAYYRETETRIDITGEKQFEMSSDGNVLVFIMDTFSSSVFSSVLENSPEYYDILSDFTFYENASTYAYYTAWSMPHLLTAHDYDFSVGIRESNRKQWESKEATQFYDLLHKNGYIAELYSDETEYDGGAKNMIGKIDNLAEKELKITTDQWGTYLGMLKLSASRYSIVGLKEIVWVDSSLEINKFTTSDEEKKLDDWSASDEHTSAYRNIKYYNSDVYDALTSGEMTAVPGAKKCKFMGAWGMHEPYIPMKEDGTDSDNVNDCMTLISLLLDRMKQLDIYDNSTIIFMGDHGLHEFIGNAPLFVVKPANYRSDKLKINQAPVEIQEDLLPTILDCIGVSDEFCGSGQSALKIDENSSRTRILRRFVYDYSLPKSKKVTGIGQPEFNGFYEYHFNGRVSDIDIDDYVFLSPIVDYWW